MMNAPHQAGTTLSAYHLPGFFFICFFFTEFFFCFVPLREERVEESDSRNAIYGFSVSNGETESSTKDDQRRCRERERERERER